MVIGILMPEIMNIGSGLIVDIFWDTVWKSNWVEMPAELSLCTILVFDMHVCVRHSKLAPSTDVNYVPEPPLRRCRVICSMNNVRLCDGEAADIWEFVLEV